MCTVHNLPYSIEDSPNNTIDRLVTSVEVMSYNIGPNGQNLHARLHVQSYNSCSLLHGEEIFQYVSAFHRHRLSHNQDASSLTIIEKLSIFWMMRRLGMAA